MLTDMDLTPGVQQNCVTELCRGTRVGVYYRKRSIREKGKQLRMLYRLLYRLLLKAVGICFNLLNLLLAGNLPPFVTVCVIVEEQGRYLVIDQGNGRFTLPGGFLRWREHPAQAAIRECEEETGLCVKVGDIVSQRAAITHRFDHMSTLTLTYQATLMSGHLRGSIEGQPCWKSETELCGKMTSYSMLILEDYLRYLACQNNLGISN